MGDTIKFVDELPKRKPGPGRPSVWPQLLAPMRERPGVWALVKECDTPGLAQRTALTLRRLGLDGRWEFHSRDTAVYGCYLGE